MFSRTAVRTACIAIGLSLSLVSVAAAQGRGQGGPPHVPPGQAKKRVVTVNDATIVTREVLVRHGYEVVRIEMVKGSQVVYYRTAGKKKKKGPVRKMYIRPAREVVIFEEVPDDRVRVDINVRLGF
jgi:hypothetical protein